MLSGLMAGTKKTSTDQVPIVEAGRKLVEFANRQRVARSIGDVVRTLRVFIRYLCPQHGFHAFSGASGGRKAARIPQSGDSSLLAGEAAILDWLCDLARAGPGEPRPRRPSALRHAALVATLRGEARIHALILLSGPRLGRWQRDLIRAAARLAASTIEALVQRRDIGMLREALLQSDEAISFYDEDEGILFTNPAYHRIFRHYPPPEQLIGQKHVELYRRDIAAGVIDDPLALRDPEAYLADRARRSATLTGSSRETQKICGRTYIYSRIRSSTGATLSRRTDITEIIAAEEALRATEKRLRSLAFTDPVTGVSNRSFVNEHLPDVVDKPSDALAIFVLDLDGFKPINDRYGHAVGDALLKSVAERLTAVAPEARTIARVGGDEFLLAFSPCPGAGEVAAIAGRILRAIGCPIPLADRELTVGASIGIAIGGTGGDVPGLIGRADLAMYEAKRCGGARFAIFDSSLQERRLERLQLIDDLRAALDGDQFEVWYQPQFAIVPHGEILAGFEALVRWRHPTRGLMPPGLFIPIAEEIGLIERIGAVVLERACRDAASWASHLKLSVNVAAIQLQRSTFTLQVASVLMAAGLAANRLELEITETALLGDAASTLTNLSDLRALGVDIALDDFGTGFSSLHYLAAFPIDKVKIDRSFVLGLDTEDGRAHAIVRAILQLGRALGISVVAEGVETCRQLEILRLEGCDAAQGFLTGRPMPAASAATLSMAAHADAEVWPARRTVAGRH
jgi:diguanylate cyclase (GGDEF)-like protein